MKKLSPDRWVFIGIIVLLLAAGSWVYILSRQLRFAKHDAAVKTVIVERDKVLNTDSVRTVIERRVQDSAAAIIDQYNQKLKTLRNENSLLKSQNATLRAAYDNISIERPDY